MIDCEKVSREFSLKSDLGDNIRVYNIMLVPVYGPGIRSKRLENKTRADFGGRQLASSTPVINLKMHY